MPDSKNPKFDNDLRDESSESSDSSKGELWIDRYLLPAIREFTLLPLLLVVMGVVVAFIAPALVFGVRDRSIGSMVSLAVIAFFTILLMMGLDPAALMMVILFSFLLSKKIRSEQQPTDSIMQLDDDTKAAVEHLDKIGYLKNRRKGRK